MATSNGNTTSKAVSKWLANKSRKLSLNRRRSNPRSPASPSSSVSSGSSSNSPNHSPRNEDDRIVTMVTRNKDDELRLVFNHFDANEDGKISASELQSYFESVGERVSIEQAKTMIGDDESLDFEAFLALMKRDESDLKSAFEIFELENGCITPRSVQRMLRRLGDVRSYEECKAMIRAFDRDGNGVLDYTEFHQMMV